MSMDENMEELDDLNAEEEDLIAFETEEGEEVIFRIEDYLFYNGEEYAILSEYIAQEDEENDEGMACIVCKVEAGTDENGGETEEFVNVEDEELAMKLIEIANNKIREDEEEED